MSSSMPHEVVVQNIVALISTIIIIRWLLSARNRGSNSTGASKQRKEIKRPQKAVFNTHKSPQSAKIDGPTAPTVMATSKSEREPAQKVPKQQIDASLFASVVEICESVGTHKSDYSSDGELQPLSLQGASTSSDDEVELSSEFGIVDSGYDSSTSSSSSSESDASDEEYRISFPMVINGTTYFSSPFASLKKTLAQYSGMALEKMSEAGIHGFILRYLAASMDELKENGYPFFGNQQKETATILPTRYTVGKNLWLNKDEKKRTCSRCQMKFNLKKNGKKGQGCCQYHPKGLTFDQELKCMVQTCCNEVEGYTNGCQKRDLHVFDQLCIGELNNFVETKKPTGGDDKRSKKILALDCEMVYTLAGPALARLSVLDWYGNLVLDCKVKPPTLVIDANTEFSGLTMQEVNGAKCTLESCRRKFLKLMNSETILVGHSLESDLKALRLVHSNIVDTSLLYNLANKKVGLKTLARDCLGVLIQSNNKDRFGHDSEEDARICLELLKMRIEQF